MTITNDIVQAAQAGDEEATTKVLLSLDIDVSSHVARDHHTICEDLMQTARESIIEALATYDPSKGASFRTWANWQMRTAIKVERANLLFGLVVPRSTVDKFGRLMKKAQGDPNVAIDMLDEFGMERETFLSILAAFEPFEYLDGTDETTSEDRTYHPTEEATDVLFAHELLETLNPDERVIVEMSMGFGCDPMTDPEIAKALDRPRTTIMTARHRALIKMRRSANDR